MHKETQDIGLLREHMNWAYRFAFFWFAFALIIFAGAFVLSESMSLASEVRPLLFIMVGTFLTLNAIWHATGLALSRIERVVLPRSLKNSGARSRQ